MGAVAGSADHGPEAVLFVVVGFFLLARQADLVVFMALSPRITHVQTDVYS